MSDKPRRRETRDASQENEMVEEKQEEEAFGTLRVCAVLVPLVPVTFIPAQTSCVQSEDRA